VPIHLGAPRRGDLRCEGVAKSPAASVGPKAPGKAERFTRTLLSSGPRPGSTGRLLTPLRPSPTGSSSQVTAGPQGLYDVAIIVSEDSDLDEAARDVYALRDGERWIAVENAMPYSPGRKPHWLPSVRRRRRITAEIFERVRDGAR
jgi:hypothetical protein